MTSNPIGALVAGVLGVVMICAVGAALFGGVTGCSIAAPGRSGDLNLATSGWPQTGAYRPEQVAMAATIVTVGADMDVPVRGWVIAVATAIQESSLSNPGGGDQDSIGLFQQRPSQGWGTPEQLHDPVYASRQFYTRLRTVPNWQSMALTDAAQAVQHSATPDAFGKWESDASMLVNTVGTDTFANISADPAVIPNVGDFACDGDGGDGQANGGAAALPADYTLPPNTPPAVATAIFWALAQLGTPYHFGGDCTAAQSGNPAQQCDCSSLVQQAYRAAGISIPRTTSEQIYAGTAVPDVSQVQPGDLLFIPGSNGTPSHPGHVGLYLGHGLLIQAPHTGDIVKISNLSGWLSTISVIRRMAP